jgi:hypothetical protein
MFKEMRQARAPRLFIFGADVIPDIDCDDRRLVVLMDNEGQAIVECIPCVRNRRGWGFCLCENDEGK